MPKSKNTPKLTLEEIKNKVPTELDVAVKSETALQNGRNAQKPLPYFRELFQKAFARGVHSLTPGTEEQMEDLAKIEDQSALIDVKPRINESVKKTINTYVTLTLLLADQLDELINKLREIYERIKEDYSQEYKEQLEQQQNECLGEIDSLTDRNKEYSVIINENLIKLGAPAYDNPIATTSMGAMMNMAQQSHVDPKTSSNKPGTTSSSSQPSSRGFLTRMRQKFTAATEAHNTSVPVQEEKAGLTRVPGKTLKSRVRTAFSNAGKNIKAGFSNLKNRITRKNNEPLIPNKGEDTKASSTTEASKPVVDPLSGDNPVTLQVGGNKTRKNRQYIHEIKENRTQLFNKEMEIINSIRNFKHGHHHGPNEHGNNKPENIQKKFIKVIKRS